MDDRSLKILLPYQQRWLTDASKAKLWEASRQIGKTFALALEAVIETATHPKPIESVFGSASARQVYKAGREIRKHIKVLRVATDDILTSEKENTETIVFPGDRILNLVPSNPDTIAGFSGHVYLDEFALHKDDRAIYRTVFPSITRGYKIRIASTHRGKKTKFYELLSNAKYSHHRTTIHDAVAEGLKLTDEDGGAMTPEDLRALLNDEEAWQEEYMVEPSDEATAYLTYTMISGVENPDLDPEPDWARRLVARAEAAHAFYKRNKVDDPGFAADAAVLTLPLSASPFSLYLGMDIGRKRDLSVIWLLADRSVTAVTEAVIVLEKAPFYVQKQVLFALLPHVVTHGRACIDQSGLGMQLAEEARDRFGSLVEGIDFTAAHKETLAVTLKDGIEDYEVEIPVDPAIRDSLHSIKRIPTGAGHFRFDAERSEKTGHADHFWALALAFHALHGGRAVQPVHYVSVGRRAAAFEKGAY